MSYESYGTYEPSPAERLRIEKERLRRIDEERQKAIAEVRRVAAQDEARRNHWVIDYEATVNRQRAVVERAERDHLALLATTRRPKTLTSTPRAGTDLGETLARVRSLLQLVPERIPVDVEARLDRVRTIVGRIGGRSAPSSSDREPLAEAERFLVSLPHLMSQSAARQRDIEDAVLATNGELEVIVRLAEEPQLRHDANRLVAQLRAPDGRMSRECLVPIMDEARRIQGRFRSEQTRAAVRDSLLARTTAALVEMGYRVDSPPGRVPPYGQISRRIANVNVGSATAVITDDRIMNLNLEIGDAVRAAVLDPAISTREQHWCASVDLLQRKLRAEGFVVHEVRRDTLSTIAEADAKTAEESEASRGTTSDTPRRDHSPASQAKAVGCHERIFGETEVA